MSQTLQSVLCITTNKYLVHVLVVLLHARFSVVSPIPFVLAAIFFSVHPYIGSTTVLPDNPFAEVNDSEMTCTLEDVCIFFSGASSIPHIGWTKQPCLEFIHDGSVLPTSSTCSLILRLPTVHSTYMYKNFKESMLL